MTSVVVAAASTTLATAAQVLPSRYSSSTEFVLSMPLGMGGVQLKSASILPLFVGGWLLFPHF